MRDRRDSYADKEAERRGQMRRDEMAEKAYRRLETGQKVRTPGGWSGFVSDKMPDGLRVYVETWDRADTFYAHEVEPDDGEVSGVSL